MKSKGLAILAFSSILATNAAAAPICSQIFSGPSEQSQNPSPRHVLRFDENGFIYAAGAKGRGQEIQFGFESEYTPSELGPLTQYYGPPKNSGVSRKTWLSWSMDQRLTWTRQRMKEIPFGSKDVVLERLDQNPKLSFLPAKLIKDDTGNVEIIVAPVSRFDVWKNQVEWINRNLGVGSMQGMKSQPRSSFYRGKGVEAEVAYREDLGYFNFIHEMDVLERMSRGAEKYAGDPTKDVMRPFLHPYLGPMVEVRHKKMRNVMRDQSQGIELSQEVLNGIIRREQSFKYIGSTAFRPDIAAPHRVSQEVRDAHKDEDVLISHMERNLMYMQEGRTAFLRAADIRPLDSDGQFKNLPPHLQDFLKTIFPPKIPDRVQGFEGAMFAHETYRTFTYPLHNFRPWLSFFNRMDLVKTVEAAQASYLGKLEATERDLKRGALTAAQANTKVQGALAEFAVESRLYEAFKKFEADFVKEALSGKSPLERLPPQARALEARTLTFLQKWEGRASLVSGVRFRHKDENQKNQSDRRMLVISTEGLSPAQKAELKNDYMNTVLASTVSFPLKERSRHLFVRVHESVPDLNIWLSQRLPYFAMKNYELPTTERIEPVVLLSAVEEGRLRKYVDNVRRDWKGTLGRYNYEGSPNSRGRLDDNAALDCGHNCTSWIATAPIGAKGESLLQLMGNEGAVPWIAQNSGWFASWLTASAPAERIPYVVLWTHRPLQDVLKANVRSGEVFEWDFNRR